MNIRGFVKQLNFWQLFRLAKILIQNPLFIYPTLQATRKTLVICDALYKKEHHRNGKANAFRHALWNIWICLAIFKRTNNKEKSTNWAKKITDLHEKLAPNSAIEKEMDLHNNKIGRQYFFNLSTTSEEEIVAFLKQNTQKAKRITDLKEISNHKNNLVYLLEE
ncbi:DUF6973 domain-containing protein [Aquimarina muelleri]|uniref:DUF6973 domain-containing protein n=1 Tax=Aquimarina muelleri TaxID=279356 RepID=A0A918N2C0_9FLAO|nr:hypothetical protein [Aquimarina muelleri]MCX2762843.1 hypothetical protein [Aquimarina muelleri]GGX11535.1 hypothetical protein GCM10007384_11530 [Aquimarina muelleri]